MDNRNKQAQWWTPSRVTFATLLGIVALQAFIYYPQLPAQLASHFDAAGRPNGWSSKSAYFALQAFIVLVLTLCFAALPAWLFLDEASSNLDDASQARLYDLLTHRLKDCTIISIAHREELADYHQQRVTMQPGPGGIHRLSKLEAQPA